MKAFLSADRGTFKMIGRSWKASFPVEDLDRWIGFYRSLAEKHAERGFYKQSLAALERVRSRLKNEDPA